MRFEPKGIIPPIVTPLNPDETLNEPVLRQLVNHFIAQGVHGLFPVGTTGEFYGLSEEEFDRIIRIVVEETAGRVPVYAGCNSIATKNVVRLVKMAKAAGADAVSVLTPMFVSQTQAEIYEYYRAIAEESELPVVIYNNRPKTNVMVNPETVARLAELPQIVGVKDSTGDMTNTGEYIRLTRHIEGFSVLVGRDTLILSGLHYGAKGAIASCANIAPRLVADIYEKFMAGDYEGALEDQFRLAPLRLACNMGSFPAVIKEGLCYEGFNVGKCMNPIQELTAPEKEKLYAIIRDIQPAGVN
ncbi:MAG: 4-hydroxy-tetrahydrodipicolinate synthase [Provencibacterium sp.]|nr:4-hydroxy-tetrahydrodipicolinate synthase [Provencibacterium sp.]